MEGTAAAGSGGELYEAINKAKESGAGQVYDI
jgi:hypothetical protein